MLSKTDLEYWREIGQLESGSRLIPPLDRRMDMDGLTPQEQIRARNCYITGRGNIDFIEIELPIEFKVPVKHPGYLKVLPRRTGS